MRVVVSWSGFTCLRNSWVENSEARAFRDSVLLRQCIFRANRFPARQPQDVFETVTISFVLSLIATILGSIVIGVAGFEGRFSHLVEIAKVCPMFGGKDVHVVKLPQEVYDSLSGNKLPSFFIRDGIV